MACKSTADVMIKIAEKLKGDADLTSLSTRYFGQGLWVCVGSYGGEEFNPENAPFVWISPSDDNSPVTLCEDTDATITQFAVNIVIGMCPLRDAPTIDGYESLADAVRGAIINLSAPHRANIMAAAACGTEEEAAAIEDTLDDAAEETSEAHSAIVTAINALDAAANAANISAFDTAAAAISSAVGRYALACESVKTAADTAAVYATAAGEETKAEFSAAAGAWMMAKRTAANAALTPFSDRVAAIDAKFAAYVEDPYFREEISSRTASASGVTVFGAVRLIDAFRRAAVKALTANDFGIPLASMKFANKSTSHYPLDWLEISANFAEPSSF